MAAMKKRRNLVAMGGRIKIRRAELNMTQRTLAKQCGITEGALRSLEHGESAPRHETLEKLCGVLCTSADYLLFGVIEESTSSPTTAC